MAPVKKPKVELGAHFMRAWREKKGINQDEAAEFISVSRTLLSKIENSKSPYSQPYVEGLARLYDATPADLLCRDPNAKPAPVRSEEEIHAFLERVEGFDKEDVDMLMSFVRRYRRVSADEPLQGRPDGQHEPTIGPHERSS